MTGDVCCSENPSKNGLIVKGDNVTAYGAAVEHFLEDQVIWEGDNGEMYFFQCELPYDVTQENFGDKGFTGVCHMDLYPPLSTFDQSDLRRSSIAGEMVGPISLDLIQVSSDAITGLRVKEGVGAFSGWGLVRFFPSLFCLFPVHFNKK
jgi:hypothetical protein